MDGSDPEHELKLPKHQTNLHDSLVAAFRKPTSDLQLRLTSINATHINIQKAKKTMYIYICQSPILQVIPLKKG